MWGRKNWGSLATRIRFSIGNRPAYGYGVFQAADMAKRLKIPAISVMEFGVAGGNGLVALEQIAEEVADHFGIKIQVLGFDTGEGMPEAATCRTCGRRAFTKWTWSGSAPD